MLYQISVLTACTVYMSAMAHICGGGILTVPPALKKLPKLLFGVMFGVASYHLHGELWLACAAAIAASFWMNTGHGTAYEMGFDPAIAQSGRQEFLSPIVDPITKAAGRPLGGVFYCWLFMGLKGLLMGITVAPFGLLLAVLWPLGYRLGEWTLKMGLTWDFEEIISGAFAGLVIGMALLS